MSVYIKGMAMPKDNTVLLRIYPKDKLNELYVEQLDIDGDTLNKYWAVELPPHGRLIDADDLRQSLKDSIDECHNWADEIEGGEMYARVSQALGTFVECSLRVKAATTIIPADKESNNG